MSSDHGIELETPHGVPPHIVPIRTTPTVAVVTRTGCKPDSSAGQAQTIVPIPLYGDLGQVRYNALDDRPLSDAARIRGKTVLDGH